MRIAAVCLFTFALLCPAAWAQDNPQVSYPSEEYYLGLRLFREGALGQAAEAFAAAQRRGRRDVDGRWIDSIPAHAMLGEVQYQMGNLVGAQENFDAAIGLMLQHEASLSNLDWPEQLLPAGGVPPVAIRWWSGGRRIQPAAVPERVNVALGELSAERVVRSGGAFQAARFISVDAMEILRALGVSAYRRAEILGPLGDDDPLAKLAVEMSERMISRSNAVAGPLWQTVQGLLVAGENQAQRASLLLQRGATVGGVEHPLSSLAGLGLARLMRAEGQIDNLRRLAVESSVSAALFDHTEWVAESIRLASATLATGADEALLTTAVSIADSYARRSRYTAVAANVVAADCAATAGNRALATIYLGNVQTLLRNRNTTMPRHEATAAWIQSRVLAAAGQPNEALAAASRAVVFGRGNGGPLVGAPTLLQRQLQAAALRSGAVAGDKQEQRLADLLQPPTVADWARDPVDALAAAVSDQSAAHAARLARSVKRGDAAASLAAADALTRSRLRAALPIGGRPLDLRWMVAGPMDALQGPAAELRNQLPGPLASLNQANLRSAAIRDALAAIPLQTDDAAQKQQAAELWNEWLELSDAMEATTTLAALDRRFVPHVFPPQWPAEEPPPIPAASGVVTFAALGDQLIGFAVLPTGTTMWVVQESKSLAPRITRLLTEIGVGRRRAGQPQLPGDDAWRSQAVRLREELLPAENLRLDALQRLVIVPTGPLWYLPFELLPEAGEDSPLIGDRIAISYSPTPGLAIQPPPNTSVGETVGYVTTLFFAPKSPEVEAEWVEKLREQHETSVSLTDAGLIPGRFASARLRTLWVAGADQGPSAGAAALRYSPLMYDAKSARGDFAEWIRFPWGAPQTVLLPGFRSKLSGDGSELFFAALALQAAGTPEALIARWPVGGVSTATALGEMLQELPEENALAAWRRATQVLRGSELDPMAEPLLSAGDRDREDLTGDHPIFWAGYMVIQGLQSP